MTVGRNCDDRLRPLVKWVRSGLKRDVLYLVAAGDEPTGQAVKRDLEAHYDERVPPKRFYGALDGLVDTGHLAVETDGVHDRYRLTDGGEAGLTRHVQWVRECVPTE
ncbi:multidrug DMT transporter permease [Halobacteriales archaeon SW_7_68_16]|nr:MAG: multidrug DMT transporter permease [Halobacteriales archaeon SW_7_68_16]